MKRLIPSLVAILGWSLVGLAATPAPLTSLRAVHALDNAQASHQFPVDFEATVTYFRGDEDFLFVQDGTSAIFVRPPAGIKLQVGDRVRVQGTTLESFRPLVAGDAITVLHRGDLPKPIDADFDQLIRADFDSMLVTVHAVVRAADLLVSGKAQVRSARVQLATDGGHFEAYVDSEDSAALAGLLDAQVEVTGISGGNFDDKMQQTGAVLYVSSLKDIRVVRHAEANPWSLPVTPMDRVLFVSHVHDQTPRVRVHGTITYYQPGSAIVLQDGPKSLWIATHSRDPLRVGDVADATGFPEAHERLLNLSDGEIQDSGVYAPIAPFAATWRDLAFWSSNDPIGHEQDLVSTEGEVVTEVREASQDEYVLKANGQLFTAIYHHPPPGIPLPAMLEVPLGAKIRVTGISTVVDPNTINPGQEVPFNILMRSFEDIAVVAQPSLLNIKNLVILIAVLLVFVFAASVRGWSLERRVRRQTTALAARTEAEAALERRMARLEKHRSRILEDINGSRALTEILEEIAHSTSFRLFGAPCWCDVSDGARLGDVPANPSEMRIAGKPILARAGALLGTLYAAFPPQSEPSGAEFEALLSGARLATLAIETRRLYSDLLHRSEFDMLTDIANRFALEKQVELLIEKAREQASIFGLVFIDLDEFKQVNDLYGHQVGDVYLQQAAARMKHQLRSHDVLARLGGDEFAALVSVVPNRAGVEEIAARLEHCFDEPFHIEDYTLQGAASVGIALYPEDAATKDSLLNSADAAMYVSKHGKHRRGASGLEQEVLPREPA